MRSMIWSAVLVHLNGRAVAFQSSIQVSSAAVRSSSEQNTPRSRQRRCSSANHRSTWLIQEEIGRREVQPDAGMGQQPLVRHRVLRVCGKGTKIVRVPLPPAVGRTVDRAVADRTHGSVLLNLWAAISSHALPFQRGLSAVLGCSGARQSAGGVRAGVAAESPC